MNKLLVKHLVEAVSIGLACSRFLTLLGDAIHTILERKVHVVTETILFEDRIVAQAIDKAQTQLADNRVDAHGAHLGHLIAVAHPVVPIGVALGKGKSGSHTKIKIERLPIREEIQRFHHTNGKAQRERRPLFSLGAELDRIRTI